jgi:hypothetical protein
VADAVTADPDWTPAHACQALARIGSKHLNAATITLLVCPKQHRLARIVASDAGPVYLATPTSPRLHSTARRAIGDAPVERAHTTVAVLHTPAYVAAMAAVNQEDRWTASCPCGSWAVPHTYVIEIAERPAPRRKGVPRTVIDTERVRPA